MENRKSNEIGLLWFNALLITLLIWVAIFHILFYYGIASFYSPDASLQNTVKDLLVAISLKGTQLNVKAFIYMGVVISLLNLLLWKVLKGPADRKRAILVGIDTGLFCP